MEDFQKRPLVLHDSVNMFYMSKNIFTNLFSEKISSTEKKISMAIYFMFKQGPLRLENTPKFYNLGGGPGGSTEVSTEAEFVVLSEAGRELCWLRSLYRELGF